MGVQVGKQIEASFKEAQGSLREGAASVELRLIGLRP